MAKGRSPASSSPICYFVRIRVLGLGTLKKFFQKWQITLPFLKKKKDILSLTLTHH